jgi:hypothetical protein
MNGGQRLLSTSHHSGIFLRDRNRHSSNTMPPSRRRGKVDLKSVKCPVGRLLMNPHPWKITGL